MLLRIYLYIAPLILNSVTSKDLKSLLLRQNGRKLSECIENYLLNKYPQYILNEITKDTGILGQQIEEAKKQALKKCKFISRKKRANPIEVTESPEIADALDYMLVSWSNDLEHMIQTREGRARLRRYAIYAQAALVRALDVFQDSDIFRSFIQILWMCRVRKLFNQYNVDALHVTYFFNEAEQKVNLIFFGEAEQNLVIRNESARSYQIRRILNIHLVDLYNLQDDSDIFYEYYVNGMSNVEYYLENHIIEFYRILFFCLELRSRGIHADEDDIYDGPLPYNLVPEQIQRIVYDDDSYRDYLLNERLLYDQLSGTIAKNGFLQLLAANDHVYEENLMMLKLNTPSISGIQFSSSTPTTTTTTTTTTTMKSIYSSTTENQVSKRKGDIWMNDYGKYFLKRSKINEASDSCCDNGGENSNKKNFQNKCADSCNQEYDDYLETNSFNKDQLLRFTIQTSEKYFGYIIFNGNMVIISTKFLMKTD